MYRQRIATAAAVQQGFSFMCNRGSHLCATGVLIYFDACTVFILFSGTNFNGWQLQHTQPSIQVFPPPATLSCPTPSSEGASLFSLANV